MLQRIVYFLTGWFIILFATLASFSALSLLALGEIQYEEGILYILEATFLSPFLAFIGYKLSKE